MIHIARREKMEHPKDPYHVRPFPKQPSRGGKELISALGELEKALAGEIPDFEVLRTVQEKIHEAVNKWNDDRLVDMVRTISLKLDTYKEHPDKELLQKILVQILKIRVELKHL